MAKNEKRQKYPDGRGKRPSDPNQLARWIVEQSTTDQKKAPLTPKNKPIPPKK